MNTSIYIYMCDRRMLEDFGGLTEVAIYPQTAVLHQMAVVLVSAIQVGPTKARFLGA